jgi:indolepyruvate ferredoxin oxidoreductase
LLAPLKVLRGTALDIFGYSEERQGERALVRDYTQTLECMLAQLNPTTLADVLRFAKLPEEIRGFGHVKARHIAAVKPSWETLGGKLP